MRHIALASIRNAASTIKSEGRNVTVEVLAKHLDRDISTVREYLDGVNGLREEVGCARQRKATSRKYTRAVEVMHVRGVTITISRIALLTGSTIRAVSVWCYRNQASLKDVTVVHGAKHQQLLLLTRIRWICKIRGRLSVSRLALITGRDRAALSKLLSDNPHVLKDL